MKIVISGYYGFNNSGDDALLEAIIKDICEIYDDCTITVLSNSPDETRKKYKVDAINRYNIPLLLSKIYSCDLLISGGGTLIQDATSTKSLMYYLFIIKIAKLFKKKVMLYANGIGPLTSFKNIDKTREILNEVDLITLRDENSKAQLEHIRVVKPHIELTADPAFLLEPDDRGRDILNSYAVPEDKEILGISIRKWKENPENFEDIIAEFCDYAADEYGFFPVFIPMQHRLDYNIAVSVKNKMKNDSAVIGSGYNAQSLISILGETKLCVGMRLHTLIYSAIANIPMIGIVYDPKVSGFLEYMGVNHYEKITDVSTEVLKKQLDDICQNYDAEKSHIKFNMNELKNKAYKNRELMKKLLDGGAF